jgi:hypothetical protein
MPSVAPWISLAQVAAELQGRPTDAVHQGDVRGAVLLDSRLEPGVPVGLPPTSSMSSWVGSERMGVNFDTCLM